MMRDNKGRFSKNSETEMSQKQLDAICYKSKILNKYFDNYEEMVAEETAYEEAEKAQLAAKNARKADAAKVEEAFKILNAAKRTYNEKVRVAKVKQATTISEAKAKYMEAIEEASKELEVAEKAYNDAFETFKQLHPEGYHVTLRDGDNVLTVSESKDFRELADFYNKLVDSLLNF